VIMARLARPKCHPKRTPAERRSSVLLVLLGRAQLLFSSSFQGGCEMAFRTICVALLLSSLPIAGCGTVVNVVRPGPEDGGKSPFGGVKQDVSCMKKAENGECVFGTHANSESSPQVSLNDCDKPPVSGKKLQFFSAFAEQNPTCMKVLSGTVMVLCAADLPLSLIGDVVTWPYVVTYSYINQPGPPIPPVMQPPAPPGTQAPTPPVTQAPTSQPMTQPTTEGRPQTYP
jgi:hypothetical protein